jgi:hypothetical protein
MTAKPGKDSEQVTPPEPVDISDEIPDRRASLSWLVIAVLVVVFVAWCSFLLYCQYEGRA